MKREEIGGLFLGMALYTFGLLIIHRWVLEPAGLTSYPTVYVAGMVCWMAVTIVLTALWKLAGYTASDV